MRNLREALSVEQNRLFVGRNEELQWVRSWLTEPNAPTQVLFLSGMGGIGKSALMLQFLTMAQDQNMGSIWIDGRICPETPNGFLESLEAFRSQRSSGHVVSARSIQETVIPITQRKTLMCVDNYESIQKLEGWLRSAFLPQFSDTGLLLVLASRQNLAIEWKRDLSWNRRVKQIELAPLSRSEAIDFCSKRGLVDDIAVGRLITDTQGLPLAMALAIEGIHLNPIEPGAPVWSPSIKVSAELLREVAAPELQETLDTLCILPYASAQELNRFLDTPLTAMQLDQLCQLSFVRPTAGGFALHDVARTYLVEDFIRRDPIGYQVLRQRINAKLAEALRAAQGEEKRKIACILLATSRDVFQLPIITTNTDLYQLESSQSTDLPHLHQIMREDGEYNLSSEIDHSLLNALSSRFPESIRVFRSKDGIPLCFTAGVLLYKETIALLETLVPGLFNLVYPFEVDQMRELSIEEADTYYQIMTGVTRRETDYSWHELVGMLTVDMVMHSSGGVRFLIITPYQGANEFLQTAGFKTQPLSDVSREHPLYGASIHQKDWRGLDFGEHILDMLNSSSGNHAISEDLPRTTIDVTETDIREALPLIDNPVSLGESKLAQSLHCKGLELQQHLRSTIFESPSFPLDWRKQEILQVLCQMPHLSAEMAAEKLHISRSTYYRSRTEAIDDLRKILIDRFTDISHK
jgi:hypothetical protein